MAVRETKSSWIKRLIWAAVALVILLSLLVVALRVFITTAPGARFIESQVNQRSFGPIEGLTISGLSGDPLSDLSVDQIVLRDKGGAWLELNDLEMSWRPFAYLKDHLWIEDLEIGTTTVLRRPTLNEAAPRETPLKVTLEDFGLRRVDLNENLIGQALSFESAGKFIVQPDGAMNAALNAARLDIVGETLALDFTRTNSGDMTGIFDLFGAADGPIAELLKAPAGTDVTGKGRIDGTLSTGSGNIDVRFDQTDAIRATTQWTNSEIIGDATITLDNWPAFDAVKSRLGSSLQSTLRVDRVASPRRFTADLNVPGLSVQATGALPEKGVLPAKAMVDVTANNLSNYAPLPEGYIAGRATAKGEVKLQSPYAFQGRVSLADIISPYGSMTSLSGPVSVTQTSDTLINFQSNLTLDDVNSTQVLPIDFAAKTQLSAAGTFDQSQSRVTLTDAKVTSGANSFNGSGTLTTDAQSLDIQGRATAAILSRDTNIPAGLLKADIAVQKTPTSLLALTTDGAFRPDNPMTGPLGGIIGDQIVFKADMSPINGGLKISSATVTGDELRAAVSGTLADQLDLSGEALVSAPVELNNIKINGGADASFVVTGMRNAPTVRVDATAGAVTAQDYKFENARLRAELSDLINAPKGPVQINAQTQHGPVSFSTDFASTPGVYVADNIDLSWGRLRADGNLALAENNIATGQIDLRLPERDGQYARAGLTLSDAGAEQGIALNVDAKEIALAGFQFDMITAKANGTLQSLNGSLQAEGRRGEGIMSRRFALETPLTLTQSSDQSYLATLSPEANFGTIELGVRAPIAINYAAGDLTATAPLTLADGTVDLKYQRNATREIFTADAARLPITIIPMPGNLADTRGRMGAKINLASQTSGGLSGDAVLTLTDWRGFDVDTDQGLSGDVRVNLIDSQANAVLAVASPAGFTADGNLRVPLQFTQSLTATRLNMTAPIQGNFNASGAAASVLGLFTPSDAELGGSLSANIDIAGTVGNPQVDGQAGGQDIRFEAPELGTRIRKGRFTANFTNDTLAVSDVYIADTDKGFLSGGGEFKLGEFGRPIGSMQIKADHFEALGRRDISAMVSGNIDFKSEAETATISGGVTINRAEVKQFVTGGVSVIEIDVEEINRKNPILKVEAEEAPTPINLNLKIRAPRRIFIRSRGLDVEMSVDATIKGTATEPLFYGEAEVLRGGYKIAGKTLDFETGTITFNGDLPSAIVDFKAVTETQNLDASVTITGSVEDPKIELSSSPERPQDEILSALLFGRSATELSTIEAAQLAGALAQFSGKGGGFDLLGGIRDAFGIGQLSVNFNEDGSAQLIGGRYLAKNVYLQVFSGAGSDQTGAIIDWEIRKNLALRSKIRADSDQSLSLKWKKDF